LDGGVELGEGGVDDKVKTPPDGEAELPVGEEDRGELIAEVDGEDGATEPTEVGSDSDRAELGEVVGVFMEGKEAAWSEGRGDDGRDLVVENQSGDFREGGEVSIRGAPILFNDVSVIIVGAVGGARFEGGEGVPYRGGIGGEGWGWGRLVTRGAGV
jgi:hypothetical protein